MDDTDYDNDIWDTWKKMGPTARMLKVYQQRLGAAQRELESWADRSIDAEVKAAVTRIRSFRVVLAELQGLDEVGGQQ